jgi:hypothetical protein
MPKSTAGLEDLPERSQVPRFELVSDLMDRESTRLVEEG